MIIDAHVHINKTEKIDRHFSLSAFHSLMVASKVSKAIVMPNVSSEIPASDLNAQLLSSFRTLPPSQVYNFYPFLLISPWELNTIPQQIDNFTISGLKAHPSISRLAIDDDMWLPYFKIAEKHCFPIIVHCGRDPLSHVSHLITAAYNNPKTTFIAAHLGGNASDLVEEAINLAKEAHLDNLYFDTSAVKLPSLIGKAIQQLGSERIIFGSDEPYSDLRVSLYIMDLLHLHKVEKENVMKRNILRLLFNE